MPVRHGPGRSAINAPGCSKLLPLACQGPGNTRATPRRTPRSACAARGAPLLPAHPTPTPTPIPAVLADRHRAFTTPLTLGIDVSCPEVHRATSAPSGLRHAHHAWLGVKPNRLLTHRDRPNRPNRLLPLETAESPIVKASTRGSNYTYKGMNAGDQASCGWKAPGSTIAWGGVGALVFLPEALQITAACPTD